MKIKISLNSRLQLLAIVLLGSMLVAAGGYFYYQFEKKSLRTEKHAELSAIAHLKVNQLTRWQEERLSEAVFFTKNYPFSEYALGIIDGNDHYKNLLKSSLTHIMTNNRYENILILSQEGKMFFSVNPEVIQLDSATINSLKNVFQTGEIDISDFYSCKIHNSIHYEVVAPIIKDGKTLAVLVFRMDPANYLFPLIEEWPTPSRTAETLLVKREGDSVVFINNLRHIENVNLSFKLPITSTEVSAVNAVLGYEGLFEGDDYRGQKVLSDISRVPNTNWYMISEIDQHEIYSAIYTRAVFITIIVFITMLLLGLGVVWIYYYRQRNIYRELYCNQEELYKSQERYRAILYSIGEGVITTDQKGIVKEVNPIAEILTEWNEKDAQGKRLQDVFTIINEETREMIENPVSLVIKNGLVNGFANNTLLISKSGKEISIADSGAPIKDEKGEIVGVVMVFRNQTEERVNEKALRESEERFKALHNASFGGIAIHDKGLILECNQGLANITGYSYDELIGMDALHLIAEESRGAVMQNILEGFEKPYEAIGLRKNGELYPIRLEARNIPYKGKTLRTVEFRDITESKQSEEVLREGEEKYRNLIEQMQEGILVVDNDDIIQFANPAFCKMLGYNEDELLGKFGYDFLINQNDKELIIRKNFERQQEISEMYEINMVTISGNQILMLMNASPVLDKEGRVIGSMSTCIDITERKKVEDALRESEEKFKNLFNSIRDAILVADTNRIVTQCNPAFHDLFGYSQEEIIGKETSFIYKDKEEFFKLGQNIEENKGNNNLLQTVIYKRSSGETFPGETNVYYLKNNHGEVFGAIGMIRDVTERKKAEDALKNSEKQFRQLVDSAPQGIYVQTNRRFAYLNPVAVKLFGAESHEELIGELVIERFHPDFRDIVNHRINMLYNEKKEVPSIEEVCLKMDGTPFNAEVSAVAINYQGVNGALVFFQDITQRKKADNELVELKNELEQKVIEKTKELNDRIDELERFREATISRELRMKELRDELQRLKRE